MADFSYAIEDFSGRARLFPVPKLVMFPHVMQPLHIFEPRYRDLVADAMGGDRLMAMPIFSPGWDDDYMGRPEVEPVACLGKIVSHQKLPDGRSNILLMGLHRIKLLEELPPSKLYREAMAEPLPDRFPAKGTALREQLQCELLGQFKKMLSGAIKKLSCLEDFLRGNISLAVLTDIVAHTLNVGYDLKKQLLAEPNVDARARMLLRAMSSDAWSPPRPDNGDQKFPPEFSLN